MNLHRSDKVPDWDKVPPEQRNHWQRVAAATHGIVTPGNAVSLAGAGLVLSGINDISRGNKFKGTMKIGVGRIGDILDGKVAHQTGTKGPRGKILDASIDKAVAFRAIPVLVSEDLVPARTAGIIGCQNVANIILTLMANRDVTEAQSSKLGKLTTAGQWGAMGFHSLSRLAENSERQRLSDVLKMSAMAIEATATALGVAATIGYARDFLGNSQPDLAEPSPAQVS